MRSCPIQHAPWRKVAHLIKQQDSRVADQRSCNGNALLLPSRQRNPLLPTVLPTATQLHPTQLTAEKEHP